MLQNAPLTCTNAALNRHKGSATAPIRNVEYPPFQMWSLNSEGLCGEQTRRSGVPGANSQTSHAGRICALWGLVFAG